MFGDRVDWELKDMNLVLPGQQTDTTQQTWVPRRAIYELLWKPSVWLRRGRYVTIFPWRSGGREEL